MSEPTDPPEAHPIQSERPGDAAPKGMDWGCACLPASLLAAGVLAWVLWARPGASTDTEPEAPAAD